MSVLILPINVSIMSSCPPYRCPSFITNITPRSCSPVLCVESYPDECWLFCNTIALAAIRAAVGDGTAINALSGGVDSALCAAMAHDKKKRGRMLRWVLPREIGAVDVVEDVPSEVVRAVLSELGCDLR